MTMRKKARRRPVVHGVKRRCGWGRDDVFICPGCARRVCYCAGHGDCVLCDWCCEADDPKHPHLRHHDWMDDDPSGFVAADATPMELRQFLLTLGVDAGRIVDRLRLVGLIDPYAKTAVRPRGRAMAARNVA